MRRLWISLIGIVAATAALLIGNQIAGNEPVLGLDLQGGASVVLEPTEQADRDELQTVADLVRDAVDSLGIAEPDVRVEGSTIVVDLPGVDDQQEALALVNVSGEVSLHPVLGCVEQQPDATGDTTPPATPAGWRQSPATPGTDPATTASTNPPAATPPASTGPGTTVPAATTTTTPFFVATTVAPEPSYPITNPDGTLLMQTRDGGVCQVGPSGGSGQVFSRKSASALIIEGGWGVETDLSGSGTAAWNALAGECFARSGSCPSGQLAIALDDEIQSAPVVRAPSFLDTVSITGDFSEDQARDLASVINRGAYPFDVQPQTVQGVSASSGKEALDAVLIAGGIGIALVLVFMLLYYRSLALVILAGLVLSGAILYGIISLLSAQRNLTLTIAGSAGIIVSVGVTVDSYVVFFERLKDEVRHGRSLRNSAARGFRDSWRTIVNANVAALIGALVLFWLSVGSVRGFAFFLAVSTGIDMVVAYFFTRPAVVLLARSGRVGAHKVLGVHTARQPTPKEAGT